MRAGSTGQGPRQEGKRAWVEGEFCGATGDRGETLRALKERIPVWDRSEGAAMGLSRMRAGGDVWKAQSRNCDRICVRVFDGCQEEGSEHGTDALGKCEYGLSLFLSI